MGSGSSCMLDTCKGGGEVFMFDTWEGGWDAELEAGVVDLHVGHLGRRLG